MSPIKNYAVELILSACLVLLISISYLPALYGDFILDDTYFIIENPHIKSLDNIPSFFTDTTTISSLKDWGTIYRPVRTLSFALDYAMWRLDTKGYHLVNIIIHALNSVLVFCLMRVLLNKTIVPFFISLFFALHPLQTEVVAWISSRGDLLALFFILVAFLLFYHSILPLKRSGFSLVSYYAGSLIAFSAGLLSKELAITFPVLLMLWIFFEKRVCRSIRTTIMLLPFFVILAGYLFLKFSYLGNSSKYSFPGGSYLVTVLSMSASFFRYIKLIIWPHPLCFCYFGLPKSHSLYDPHVITGLALFFSLVYLTGYMFCKGERLIAFFMSWFFAGLVPVSNLIVPLNVLMAERFLYMPLIGFFAAIFILIDRLALKKRAVTIILGGLLILGMSISVFHRSEFYMVADELMQETYRVAPKSPLASVTLALRAIEQGDNTKAEIYLLSNIKNTPGYFRPLLYLAVIYAGQKRFDEAENLLLQADRLSNEKDIIWYYHAKLFEKMGKSHKAIEKFQQSLQFFPGNANVWFALGKAELDIGHTTQALKAFNQAILLNPDNPNFYYSRANLYILQGKLTEAHVDINFACSLSGENGYSLFSKGLLADKSGQREKALKLWNDSVVHGINDPMLYFNLGTTHLKLGHFQQSKRYFELLFMDYPHYTAGMTNYAISLYQVGFHQDALFILEKYLAQHPDDHFAQANYILMHDYVP
ncbi:tetratricopeptide repeat protein [bacterium]|nr:tetratricopeptide repeat protein [bacterium]